MHILRLARGGKKTLHQKQVEEGENNEESIKKKKSYLENSVSLTKKKKATITEK